MRAVPIVLLLAACAEPLVLKGVRADPGGGLTCLVRWTTSRPATSRVEARLGDLAGATGSDALVREHEVLVAGLTAEATWSLVAISEEEDGDRMTSAPVECTTPALPFEPVHLEVTAWEPELAQPGWTLANLAIGGMVSPVVAVVIDPAGRVRWAWTMGEELAFGGVETSLHGDRVLVGGSVPAGASPVEVDLGGAVTWEGPVMPDGLLDPGVIHHTTQRLDDGSHAALRYDEIDGVLVDVLEVWDDDLETTWSWHAADHLPEATEEHLHANMALFDGDRVYVSLRAPSALLALDRATGDILWKLGDGGDFELVSGDWFLHAHAPELQPGGGVLLYDNGDVDTRPTSRVVEYAVDEEAGTAEVTWEYPGDLADDDWFTFAWGDADRMPNGNTLVSAGSVLSFDDDSRVFEVTPAGDIAWELRMEAGDGGPVGTYMVERVPPLLEPL